MRKGIHCITGGFNEDHVPSSPTRYNLDNGDYKKNMKITYIDLIHTGNENGQLDSGNPNIYVQLGVSAAGATPVSTNVPGVTDQFGLDLTNSGAIGWACLTANGDSNIIIDPGHIVPQDLFINAWTINTGGTLSTLVSPVGYLIHMEQVTSSGDVALLQTVKQHTLRS
jgi:hypothetical protein